MADVISDRGTEHIDKDGLAYFWQKIKKLPQIGMCNVHTEEVTIAVADWSGQTATKTVSGVSQENLVICSSTNESRSIYSGCDIYCSGQGTDTLTFSCATVPVESVTVNVAIADTVETFDAFLGSGFGTCSTAAATTAKVVTMDNYRLATGGYVTVQFTNSVPANATMNINSKGAKPIYWRNAAITADVIYAGDTVTFVYDGSYYRIVSIDSNMLTLSYTEV